MVLNEEDVLPILMEGVHRVLALDEQEGNDGARDGQRKTDDVDHRRGLVLKQIAVGNVEIVLKHDDRPVLISTFVTTDAGTFGPLQYDTPSDYTTFVNKLSVKGYTSQAGGSWNAEYGTNARSHLGHHGAMLQPEGNWDSSLVPAPPAVIDSRHGHAMDSDFTYNQGSFSL